MRNLKRVLSTIMAVAMMMSLVVFSASASFSDQNKIENTDAVNMNVALGIINGLPDGTFNPTGNVTRAEMAKMICVALNGGKDPVLGTLTTPSYKDIKGHWAEAYIEYCTSLGIVAGMGDGTFAPNANVTGTQAAKMLLVALGFDAAKEGFNGGNWSVNINVRASQKGLYADLAINPNVALNRDSAAQMIYNALEAVMVKYEYKLTTDGKGAITTVAVVGDDGTKTILTEKFKMDSVKGVLTGITYNPDTKKYTYTYSNVSGGTITAVPAVDYVSLAATKTDYTAFYGQYVKILYKDGATENTIYGMYDEGGLTVKATLGQLDSVTSDLKKVDVNGTEYKLLANYGALMGYVFDNAGTEAVNLAASGNKAIGGLTVAGNAAGSYDVASDVILVSHDSNTTIDYAVVLPKTVAKVTNVTPTGVNAGTSYTYEDDNIVSGLKKNDFVVISAKANSFIDENTLTKANVISGKIDGTKAVDQVKVNGTWYKKAANPGDTIALGETFDVVVVGNYYYNLDKTSDGGASISNLIFISAAENATPVKKVQAKAYFVDGTNAIISVSKYSASGTANLTDTAGAWSTNSDVTLKNKLYTYTKDSDGYYRITEVNNANKVDMNTYDATLGHFVKSTSTTDALLDGYTIADDATIFVKDADGTKVYTGAQVNKWSGNLTNTVSIVLTDTVNGLEVVKAGLMVSAGTAANGATDNYGYVVSTPYSVKDGDDTYRTYDLWNGKTTVTVIDKDLSLAVAKGSILTYTDLGNGYIESDSIVALKGAVAGFSAKSLVADYDLTVSTTGDQATYILDEDTQYLYIDTKGYKGVTTGSISVADKDVAGTSYVANVYVIPGTGGTADLVVMEVNNKVDVTAVGTVYTIAAVTKTVAGATGTYPVGDFTVVADKTVGYDNDVITYTVTYTGAVNDANDTITVVPTATSGADTFVNASGAGLTGIAPGKTWTCSMAIDGANVVGPTVTITTTANP